MSLAKVPGAMSVIHHQRGAINIHAEHVIMRAVNLVPPYLIWIFVLGLGFLFNQLWGENPVVVMSYFIPATALLTGLTWKLSHSRKKLGRYHNPITTAVVCLWLMFATMFGIFGYMFHIWLGGGLVLILTWNLRTAIRGDGEQHDTISWSEIDEKAQLGGSKWTTLPSTSANKILGLVTTPGKPALATINPKRQEIAALAKVPLNNVRAIPVPERADQVQISIVKEDHLRKDITWTPSEFAGQSIADGPIRLGVYEDGEPVKLNLYSPAGARHLLITGMNGVGKSIAARVIVSDLFMRRDVNVIAIDAVKGTQTLGCAVNGLDWFITKKGMAEGVLARMISIVNKRADYLGKKGLDAWEPDCGLNFLVVLIEEAPAVIRDSDTFTRIVEQARSAGVSVICSIQRASGANMDTNARAQFGLSLCFGVKTTMDASFALSDDLIERGADPSVWQQKRPGYAYLQAPDIDEDKDVSPLRVGFITTDQVHEVAELNPRKGLDAVTSIAAGDVYQDYLKELDEFIEDVEESDDGVDEDEDNYKESLDEPVDSDSSQNQSDNDDDLIEGFDEESMQAFYEVAPEDNFNFGPETREQVRLSPDEARSVFTKHVGSLGSELFFARDLYPILEKTGRKRPWLHAELNRRVENGTIERDENEGGYRAVVFE
jgi:hypothetical protein